MLTVVFEQFKPERKYIGQLVFDDRKFTIDELTTIVEKHINNRLWLFQERMPEMTELRWEYQEVGQGHYVQLPAYELEAPITWVGKLNYQQMVDVMSEAVRLQDWRMVEDLSYQLRMMQDSCYKYSYNEFVLPVELYKFDWMDIE